MFRAQCEKAVATVGLDYRSDAIWEHYIDREIEAGQLRYSTDLFRRVIGIPTKLYNKHWDNFIGKYISTSSLAHVCLSLFSLQ